MSIFFWKTWRTPSSCSRSSQASRRVPKRRPLYSRRLELERLEDRIVPSLTVLSNYTGLDTNNGGGFEPPDTQGAAGPSSVVETVNQSIRIDTPKSTGAAPVTDTLADFFFTKGGLANGGATFEQSDPFTIYDPQVQRFIVGDIDFDSSMTNGGANYLLLAVSTSNNPATLTTADWTFSELTTTEAGVALQDYPGNPGYNADALVVTQASFDSGGGYVHTLVNAISMNALVTGAPLTVGTNTFQTDISEVLPRPAVMPDSTPGGPMWMTASAGGGVFGGAATTLDVVEMTNVLSATPTFTTTTLTVNPYFEAVNALDPVGPIDTVEDSRMLQSAERNGIVVTANTVSDATGNLDNANWYAIDVSSGTPVLQQEGAVSGGAGVYDAYPGININGQGDIGVTYMQSGTAPGQFESMYITGRTPADAPGTMETPVLIQAGSAAYNGTRQGDMSRVSVDPNGTFWAFSEWANNEAAPNWGTAIANFTLAAPISVVLTSATEGIPLNDVPVATFIDNSGVPLSSYTASIDWGDGTLSNGTVIATGINTFEILGSHTYIDAGDYLLTVSVNNGTATIGPVSGIVRVADAPLIGSSQLINAATGEFVSDTLVAIFRDTDTTARPPGQYTATITWNEGYGLSATSVGTIAALGGNTFAVYGGSPYSFPAGGLFTVQVVVRDVLGGASVTIDSVVNVTNNPAIPPYIPLEQIDTGPTTAQYVSMEDALTNLLRSEQLFLTAYAFGTMPQKQAAFGNLLNAYYAYQAAVFAFDMSLPGG